MQDKLERLIKEVYKKWRLTQPIPKDEHPDEETLACFLENRLSGKDSERIKVHIVACDVCSEIISACLSLKETQARDVPEEVLERVKDLIKEDKSLILEIFLKLKEKALEILNTTGDVLVGQEFVPAPVLRSRSIKDFKDEINIIKDFKDIRVEAKIENKAGKAFNLIINVKQKETQEIIKDLRVTLIRDDLELESYLTDAGAVTFEHVLWGKYKVEISSPENKLASILLDVKV
jgi:hypothetical protein